MLLRWRCHFMFCSQVRMMHRDRSRVTRPPYLTIEEFPAASRGRLISLNVNEALRGRTRVLSLKSENSRLLKLASKTLRNAGLVSSQMLSLKKKKMKVYPYLAHVTFLFIRIISPNYLVSKIIIMGQKKKKKNLIMPSPRFASS